MHHCGVKIFLLIKIEHWAVVIDQINSPHRGALLVDQGICWMPVSPRRGVLLVEQRHKKMPPHPVGVYCDKKEETNTKQKPNILTLPP